MTISFRSILLMLGFVLIWTITEAVIAPLLLRHHPFQVVWLHYLMQLGLWVLIVGLRSPASLVRTGMPLTQILRALCLLLMPVSWALALQNGVGDAAYAAFWATPILVILFSALLFGDRLPALIWSAAVAGGLAGAALFLQPTNPEGLEWLAILGMPLSFSLFIVLTRRLKSEPVAANLFYLTVGIVVLITPAIPAVWMAPDLQDLLYFLITGGLSLMALLLLDRAARTAPFAPVAPLLLAPIPMTFALIWLADFDSIALRTLVLVSGVCLACAVPILLGVQVLRKKIHS